MRLRITAPLLALTLATLTAGPARAQLREAPPQITGPPTLVVTEGTAEKALEITALDVQARVVGHLAETSITMTFFNPGSRALAGDLTFPLPSGATVSGYALDVDGALVEGVVVDKQKARQVFEAEVRKGIDPGLVEKVAGAAYRTRVFPIPARGSRTVRVSWVSELVQGVAGARYQLPLGFDKPIKDVHVRLDVVRATVMPTIDGEGLGGLGFGKWEDRFVAETTLKNALLDKPIAVVLPDLDRRPVAVERAPDGQVYFSIHDTVSAPKAAARITPDRVAILWDASLSRADVDHGRELAALTAWIGTLAPRRVAAEVVVFADALLPTVTFQLPGQTEALVAYLQGTVYDGGTRMAALQALSARPAPDLYLLFSDGISNLGEAEPPRLDAPLYAINGAAVANHDVLRALSLGSGGAWIDLTTTDDAAAADAIGRAPFSFRRASAPSGLGESYPRIAEPANGVFSFAGILEQGSATVTLRFEGAGSKPVERTFAVNAADATEGTVLQRFWATKKVNDLAVGGARNELAIAQVGKRFGIVTTGTSLLVLERLDQYVEHDIRPPASLVAMRKAWDDQKAQQQADKKVVAAQKLERILALWEERVAWWGKEFDLRPAKDGKITGMGGGRGDSVEEHERTRDDEDADEMGAAESMMSADAPAPMSGAARRESRPSGAPKMKKADDGSVADPGPPPPSITLKAWDPATPYLAALKASPGSEHLRVYLAQRASFGTSPAFFLDCADFFLGQGARAMGLRVLTNIVELDLEDPALLRVLASRLAQIDELDLAVLTFERVAELRPDEPQSHRDLALALSRRAAKRATDPSRRAAALNDYQRALDLLARVVMDEWERFAEIELLALVELNNFLPRAQALGAVRIPVDSRLIKALDMDIRIVMSWDADLTDMDLHVIEPSGEEAYYSHNRTSIGGRVSRDFTQGYGPEEYSIRAAMHGTYTVRTKFFGSSAAELQGAVTLYLDLYTDYGRPTEQRQSVTIRLAENKETFTVGEITFAGAAKITR
mgnify:CR=1 FL=1